MKLLAHVLVNVNKSLQWFDLRLNESVSDSSFDSLVNRLKCNQSLTMFSMEYCNLSRPVKEKLREIDQAKDNFDINLGA